MGEQSPLNRLWSLSDKEHKRLILSMFLSIIGVIGGLVPYLAANKIIYGLIYENTNNHYYVKWLLIAGIGYIIKSICYSLSLSESHKSAFNILQLLRENILDKLPKLPLGSIIQTPSGEIKQIIIDQIETMERPIAHLIPELTSNVIGVLLTYVYLFFLDWRLGILSILSIPLGMLFMRIIFKGYEEKYKGAVEIGSNMNTAIVEYIDGIEIIKTFNQGDTQYKKFKNLINENANYYYNWMKETQLYMSISKAIMPTTLLFLLPVGWIFYKNGSLSPEVFFTAIILSFSTSGLLISSMNFFDSIARLGTVLDSIYSILNSNEQVHLNNEIKTSKVDIEIKNINFGYSEDKVILNDVSLDIKSGTINAFVGPSGSGKSTLAKLIAGYWDVNGGQIKIGGINTSEVSLINLYKNVSFVSQDNFLFNESILENIRKGDLKATDNEIIDIAKVSGCHEFIEKLENGYETIVGSSGGNLSGGERQRITIARAMLKDSPIIILDEATAYIDPENEAIIQKGIKKLIQNKTVIMIAHRLSTITDVDNIFVVENGKIVENGKHDDLLKNNDLYKIMWNSHISSKDGEYID